MRMLRQIRPSLGAAAGRPRPSSARRRVALRLALAASLIAASPSGAAADNDLADAVSRFSKVAARLLGRSGRTAYTFETASVGRDEVPDVDFAARPASAFTDCSGWVNYVLATAAPLHQALIAEHRFIYRFNQGPLNEAAYPWPRAAVVYDYLAGQRRFPRKVRGGFRRVVDFRNLKAGDVVAWCLGEWCTPDKITKIPKGDTGHTFVVVDAPGRVPRTAPDYDGRVDGRPTLDTVPGRKVTQVIRVAVVDSSDIRHFDDTRTFGKLPKGAPPGTVPGGVGRGDLWIALEENGAPVQFRFAQADAYYPNPQARQRVGFAAGRPAGSLSVGDGLAVARYPNAVTSLGSSRYGDVPVTVFGNGRLIVEGGSDLALTGNNTFDGAVSVHRGARLTVRFDTNLGDVENAVVLAGELRLEGGFLGNPFRQLRVPGTALLTTPGDATWTGPVTGGRLTVEADGYLALPRLGKTVHGRTTINLPAKEAAAAP
jgi:autotransporter-associated beta strand protein